MDNKNKDRKSITKENRSKSCNGNPVGVKGQREDRKIQGRQTMCRSRGSEWRFSSSSSSSRSVYLR